MKLPTPYARSLPTVPPDRGDGFLRVDVRNFLGHHSHVRRALEYLGVEVKRGEIMSPELVREVVRIHYWFVGRHELRRRRISL